MTLNADTSEATASNSEPICNCGETRYSAKDSQRCINGHLLRGNRAAAITGEHGANFRREHSAEIDAMADQFARDAGYPSVKAAPLGFQIAAIALARTAKVGDLAYWKMLEAGGPLSESGKPRRAYSIWADTNRDLARDLKGAMSEVVAARPPGAEQRNQYEDLTLDELIALTDSIGSEARKLKEQADAARESRSQFTDSKCGVPPVLPTRSASSNNDPAFSRDSTSTSTAPLPRSVTRASAPRLSIPPDSGITPPQSPEAPRPVPASSGRPSSGSPESVTIHDDPYARFRNV